MQVLWLRYPRHHRCPLTGFSWRAKARPVEDTASQQLNNLSIFAN